MAGTRVCLSPSLCLWLLLLVSCYCWVDTVLAWSNAGNCSLPSTKYLHANKETVRWGYYDLSAPFVAHVQSGDEITVEAVTHHAGDFYAGMIAGDKGVESIYKWLHGESALEKNVLKPPGSGVHVVTGPINMCGCEPGDVLQVDILDLRPRKNPATGKTYGSNAAKVAGYQFRVGHRNGTAFSRTGGDEAVTIYEFVMEKGAKTGKGKPILQYKYPKVLDPSGLPHALYDLPGITIPHPRFLGTKGALVRYPKGFRAELYNQSAIEYTDAKLDYEIDLRPHLGIMALMPANGDSYINGVAGALGASTAPPSKFGGNVDDWRIGKGATMYYKSELPGCRLVLGDTHAAQGDSELDGTAMETSLTVRLRLTLHKADTLPPKLATISYPLLETEDVFVVHGFAFKDYLSELPVPSTIFTNGSNLNGAFTDVYVNTRDFLMDVFDVTEDEALSIMATAVDYTVTQVVDGNWGIHGSIKKSLFKISKGRKLLEMFKGTAGQRKLLSWFQRQRDSQRQ